MPQANIYDTPHFKKFQKYSKNPAKRIVDVIRPVTKKVDHTKDWGAITKNSILPYLQNPLTKQTGTYEEKKSLKEFVEECKVRDKAGGATCLSKYEDSLDREFFLKLSFDKRKKDVAIFWVEYCIDARSQDGTHTEDVDIQLFKTILEERSRDMSANALWDAHFKACCKFTSLVNNCLCEHLRIWQEDPEDCPVYIYGCTHKKACNSTVCLAHLHKHCVDFHI